MKTLLMFAAITLGPGVFHGETEVVLLCEQSMKAVDGDTITCDGRMLRDMGSGEPFESGYDAPEIIHPQCAEELRLGLLAKERMQWFLQDWVQIVDSGIEDSFGRGLVWAYKKGGNTSRHCTSKA